MQQDGAYENLREYVRDLIRRDMARKEQQAFGRLNAELTHAFAAPASAYKPLTAADVMARNAADTRSGASGETSSASCRPKTLPSHHFCDLAALQQPYR